MSFQIKYTWHDLSIYNAGYSVKSIATLYSDAGQIDEQITSRIVYSIDSTLSGKSLVDIG